MPTVKKVNLKLARILNDRAVALGLFDGVHVGHRKVIEYTVNSGFVPSVFTFGNMAAKNGRRLEYIYSNAKKQRLLTSLGIADVISEDFEVVRDMSGEEFVLSILSEKMNAATVVCGTDFRFGRGASCSINELQTLSQQYGFRLIAVEDVTVNGLEVSSGKIRQLLKDGHIATANTLLYEGYSVSKEICRGNRLGRTVGFPTINQYFAENEVVPKFGVYDSVTKLDGKFYKSITNVGVKPTVESAPCPVAETHILDYAGNLYGRTVDVELKAFLRPEKKFKSIEELKKAIEKDVHCIRHGLV